MDDIYYQLVNYFPSISLLFPSLLSLSLFLHFPLPLFIFSTLSLFLSLIPSLSLSLFFSLSLSCTLGDDMLLSVYSIHQSTLLFSTQLTHYVHDLKWDPATAYEFATVGVGGVNFWMYEETSGDLQVHKPTMPSAVTEVISICIVSIPHNLC